ncbi:uncharacterized protein LOC133298795 [Gastrolobium bilobum]|uniref:uncharacterized protein LOC133298795 n=1 Tax=Gastrolobium bilobum TaxID=150636 RepID=UPI002AB05978|nr:uncharacterized protein LOC133298795 [Gastrolobium bilobum]
MPAPKSPDAVSGRRKRQDGKGNNAALTRNQGAVKASLGRTLKFMVDRNKASVVVLMETRTSSVISTKIMKKVNFDKVIAQEASGFAGGIWVLWDSRKVAIQLISSTAQFIHMKIVFDNSKSFLCTAVYANPNEDIRHGMWEEIMQISSSINEPWILGDTCRVEEIEGLGAKFTWQGHKWHNLDRVFKKLDRVCANSLWRINFEDADVRILPRIMYDHNPLVLSIFKQFYKNLFEEEVVDHRWIISDNMWPVLSQDELRRMVMLPNDDEIRQIVFSMGAYKAPGYDGFHAIFFQRNWERLKVQVCTAMKNMWSNPDSITEIIVGRLKHIMERVVSPYQVSFVPNRQIQDNITIVQELVHSMSKMRAKRAYMAIKIDLVKAYDRGLMFLWNGGKIDDFIPTRGLRQGDPLSPYLLVLAMDKLTHIITTAVNGGLWKPMHVGKGGPKISHLAFADDLMLFMEASEDQIQTLFKCLKIFEEMSGQKLSVEKTSVYFSKNTSKEIMDKVVQFSGFKCVNNVRRYLGAMMRQGRVSKHLYDGLVEKVRSKLTSWEQQCLSQAGKITLSQSILAAILAYRMQSCKLPLMVCEAIEKLQINFIWGDKINARRHHPINWNVVTSPKLHGGLGLRNLARMNDAFLAKKAWKIYTEPEQLWVQVMHAKYKIVAYAMENNLEWELGNGKEVRFWKDVWLPSSCKLEDFAEDEDILRMDNVKVADVVSISGEWVFSKLNSWLPLNIVDIIRSVLPPNAYDGPDRKIWGIHKSQSVSVSFLYDYLSNYEVIDDDVVKKTWNRLWTWKGPQRIKIFIWKMLHQKLLTNSYMSSWNGSDGMCSCGSGEPEFIIHALRDCHRAKVIWDCLILIDYSVVFFDSSFEQWISINFSGNFMDSSHDNWLSSFLVTCWKIWSWRNMMNHGEEVPMVGSKVEIIKKFISEMDSAITNQKSSNQGPLISNVLVSWTFPEVGFVKVNTDGASCGNPGVATCGGVIRNSQGIWLNGFAYKLGFCSSFKAELWGILRGLEMAWSKGYRKIILESDSLLASNHCAHQLWCSSP